MQSPISPAAAVATPDAPIFDPKAFRLGDEQAAIIATARGLGQTVFAGARRGLRPRSQLSHRELQGLAPRRPARHRNPEKAWRPRRGLSDLRHLGRRNRPLLRRHRADLEHACLLHAVVGPISRRSRDGCRDARRTRGAPRGALQAHRRGRRHLFAAVLGRRRGSGRRRRVRHRSKTGQGRLDRQRQEDFCLAVGPRRLLRRALHRNRRRRKGLAPQYAVSRDPCESRRRLRGRRLGSAGHARHGVAHAHLQGRVRGGGRRADAARRLFPGGACAGRTCS